MTVDLGIIEGRFGTPWPWDERTAVMHTLAAAGYRFYHYGPKGDANLRRRWREQHLPEQLTELRRFAAACRGSGMRFGIALTPIGAIGSLDPDMKRAIRGRLAAFDDLGIDDLAILFDDLRGDLPNLARDQAEVVDFCTSHSRAANFYFCPTYYSTDPILDHVFGARPEGYLAELGRRLDPKIHVYWTGEEVCSRQLDVAHLKAIETELGRPVCVWDNYPVNDGARMSRFLHLRAFTGRSAEIARHVSGHAINPANQPRLSCIPALTLAAIYSAPTSYSYAAAFRAAAATLLGQELASLVEEDLPDLQDVGWERLGDRRENLRSRYRAIDHPAAAEIVAWLDGRDIMTDDDVKTQ